MTTDTPHTPSDSTSPPYTSAQAADLPHVLFLEYYACGSTGQAEVPAEDVLQAALIDHQAMLRAFNLMLITQRITMPELVELIHMARAL